MPWSVKWLPTLFTSDIFSKILTQICLKEEGKESRGIKVFCTKINQISADARAPLQTLLILSRLVVVFLKLFLKLLILQNE